MPPPHLDQAPGEPVETAPQAIVLLPLAAVLLAGTAAVNHYRTVDTVLAQGARLEAARQYDRAAQAFQEASRRDPRDERPHNELGSLYLAQHKYDQAIQEYEDTLRLGTPEDYQVQFRLGVAYRLNGNRAKADQNLEAALGKNPHNAEAQLILAELYAEQKLYPDAITHYKQALSLEANSPVAHNNLAWLYATCEDPKYRDPKAALEHAQRAVELTKWRVAGFVDTLAEAHFASGDYQQAVDIQKKALALEPGNQELQEHMARYRKAAGV
jgi:tetratricopeptide (TPR) repeat protein